MRSFQIVSVEEPYVSSEAMALALSLVARAQSMGLLPANTEEEVSLGQPLIDGIAREMQRAGIATVSATRLRGGKEGELLTALRAAVEALAECPLPEGEWGPVRETLPDALLAPMLGDISISSLRRYADGDRRTPDEVAWRLHVIAGIIAALAGSYNSYGISRWFQRPRAPLGGATPFEVIRRARNESDERLQVAIALAEDLLGSGAAA